MENPRLQFRLMVISATSRLALQMRRLFQNVIGNAPKIHAEEKFKPVVKIYAKPAGGRLG